MMDIEEEDVNLGCSKFSIHTKLLRSSGAGVNADSRLDLDFATSDLLSELVWSPCNGLSLKCATSAGADNKPVRVWDLGLNCSRDHAGDMIIDKPALLAPSEMERDRMVEEGADKKDGIAAASNEISGIQEILPETPLKKLESCAENEVCGLTERYDCSLGGAEVPRETAEGSPTDSRVCLYEEKGKGKGKALSDGDRYGTSSVDEDESHETADSCNGGGLSSKGIKGVKRQIYDRGVVFGSKRLKMQIYGSHGSTSVTKPDSSFMNWILNMTKGGVSDCNKEDSPSPLTLAACFRQQHPASIRMGFQTIFKSLYGKEADAKNAEGKGIAESTEECRENAVDDEKPPENLSCDRNCGKSEQSGLCNKAVDSTHSANVESSLAAKEAHPDTPTATSLWITRFSTKTTKGKEIAEADLDSPIEQNSSENRGESADSMFNASMKGNQSFIIKSEASFEVKSILPSQRFSSEAMSSVFARRLDALRHITSSKTGKSAHVCFFCGGCHDVHECPNITKSELEDLLLKLSTFNYVEESSSCWCIRCSASDHWAVSCPLSPCSSRKPPLGYFPKYQTWKLEIGSSETRRHNALKSTKDVQNTVAKSQIFDVIRKLRLSRADILRWLNSYDPLPHLNGFFIRLRLGKAEAGLEGSSYYVACSTEAAGEARETDGNKSILVDVGGMKSYVATQYVSNHDFLEEEMEAWWCRCVDSGCKLPSLFELNSKLNDRKTMGADS